ncbi:MAG: hypothetical protein AAF714_07020 [Pseudomonadota bacterium]
MSEEIEFEYFQVKIGISKKTGYAVSEEWFHDPDPKEGLKPHGSLHPSKTFYDAATGAVIREEHYQMGEWVWTSGESGSLPEPER